MKKILCLLAIISYTNAIWSSDRQSKLSRLTKLREQNLINALQEQQKKQQIANNEEKKVLAINAALSTFPNEFSRLIFDHANKIFKHPTNERSLTQILEDIIAQMQVFDPQTGRFKKLQK